jgi:purine-binding chemotaxis protein CheW
VEIRYVLQIIGMQEINEMPEMPHYMKGYINLRGVMIPVVSVRVRFGKPEEEYSDRTCIVVVQVGEKEIGLIVDGIRETLTIEPEDISPQPSTGEQDNPYISGIAKIGGNKTSVLINLQKLFSGYTF